MTHVGRVSSTHLCHLKNYEILDFFWRSLSSQKKFDCEYVDLALLQEVLDEQDRTGEQALSDEDLEKELFGPTQSSRRYTGWTTLSLEELLRKIGQKEYKIFSKPGGKPWEKLVSITPTPISSSLKREFHAERLNQKIWDFRKKLRLRAVYLKGRLKAAWHPLEVDSYVQKNKDSLNLNLGAGTEVYEGYINVDWAGMQHVYDNIVQLQKFKKSSVDKIYSNHVLEHIPENCIDTMLKRWLEVLKPSGVVVVRIPDGRAAVQNLGRPWQEATTEQVQAFGLPNYLGRESGHSGILDVHSCFQTIFGWSASTPYSWDESNQHKTLWTPDLARARFEKAGFRVEWCGHLGTLQTVLVAKRY